MRSGINEATARSVVGVEECGQGDELAGALDGTIADELGLRRTGRLLSPHEVDEQADPRPCQRQQLPADFVHHLPYPDLPAGGQERRRSARWRTLLNASRRRSSSSSTTWRERTGQRHVHGLAAEGRSHEVRHLFEFRDEAAHEAHGRPDGVRKFEAVYQPEQAAGPVVCTDYVRLASATRRRA